MDCAANERQRRRRAKQKELSGSPETGLSSRVAQLEGLLSRPAWQSKAACRGCDPDLFFLDRGEPSTEALKICRSCPVKNECLEYGLHERHGIWGGMSERQRRWLRKVRKEGKIA